MGLKLRQGGAKTACRWGWDGDFCNTKAEGNPYLPLVVCIFYRHHLSRTICNFYSEVYSPRMLQVSLFDNTGSASFLQFSLNEKAEEKRMVLASGDRDHILSGVFNQFLSEKSEPAE